MRDRLTTLGTFFTRRVAHRRRNRAAIDGATLAAEVEAFLRAEALPDPDGLRGAGPVVPTILLPCADLETCDEAIAAVAALRPALAAEVRVVHVRTWDRCRGACFFLENRSEALRVTRGAAVRLQRLGVAARGVLTEAARADVADAILSEAARVRACVIVLSTRRRTAFGSLFLGSITRRVLRRADCPVMLVRARSLRRYGPVLPPTPEEPHFERRPAA